MTRGYAPGYKTLSFSKKFPLNKEQTDAVWKWHNANEVFNAASAPGNSEVIRHETHKSNSGTLGRPNTERPRLGTEFEGKKIIAKSSVMAYTNRRGHTTSYFFLAVPL